MDTQKLTTEYRLSQWEQMIQKRHDSGQNIQDFCKTVGITKNAYFYWQRKLRKATCAALAKPEEPKNIVPNGWTQLVPSQAQQMRSTLTIEISGCYVSANSETDSELLAKVCRVLRSL
jgi:putative transposase